MKTTFREYLKELRDVIGFDYTLVGGAARNYYIAYYTTAETMIKSPKDIDIIVNCTQDEFKIVKLHVETCKLFGPHTISEKSVENSCKFSYRKMGSHYCYDIDMWCVNSIAGYCKKVYTAADGIAVRFPWLVATFQTTDEFDELDITKNGLKHNHIITDRKTQVPMFGLASFINHCKNQEIVFASQVMAQQKYKLLQLVNNKE